LVLVLDEEIEADENVERSDKLEDESFVHDTAKAKHGPDSGHHEFEDDDSQMFEADSDSPLLQGVSLPTELHVTLVWCILSLCLEETALRKVKIWVLFKFVFSFRD
jgi:hypothetical protein